MVGCYYEYLMCKLKEKMDKYPLETNQEEYVNIIDMDFYRELQILHIMIKKLFKEVGGIIRGVTMLRKLHLSTHHPKTVRVFCVNESYHQKTMSKIEEFKKVTNSPNVAIKPDDKFSTSFQFRSILQNSNGKIRLQHLIESKLYFDIGYSLTSGIELI